MYAKILTAMFVVFAAGLILSSTLQAGGGCTCSSGSSDYYYSDNAQASNGRRVYSYEPGTRASASRTYSTRSFSTRTNVPKYLLPKGDPRKYR